MNARRFIWIILFILISAIILAACAPAFTEAPKQTSAPAQAATAAPKPTEAPRPTLAPQPTQAPAATGVLRTATAPARLTQIQISPLPTLPATAISEQRFVELEYPPQMRLGDSDIIRLALIPTKDGMIITTEFPDHTVVTDTVNVLSLNGYDLYALARLDGVGFDFAPPGEQPQPVVIDQRLTWRWSLTPKAAGQQRLSLTLKLQWRPQPNNPNPIREAALFSKGLNVQVNSFFGLTTRQAAMMGMIGVGIGFTFSLPLAASLLRPRRKNLQSLIPNLSLSIEHPSSLTLTHTETTLLRALFQRYQRITLEAEFRSGYSGARTFLILPVRADGRADAYTIAKLGEREAIQHEYQNYETHVKDTLPPMTARIQELPVTTRNSPQAAVRYTFIAEPNVLPKSLREMLLANPDSALLEKIFNTFGPNWWMQRKPYTFKLAQEYDRLLPAHYVLEPSKATPDKTLQDQRLRIGDVVRVKNLRVAERRADGKSLSLIGAPTLGMPPLRVRWLSLSSPEGASATIVATRESLLREYVAGFDLFGLPDPLVKLPTLLDERLISTQSTIHGDLNLENVLVGPGGFVWLIDFAQTREGHPLFDFAHLEAEIIAHVFAPQMSSEQWAVNSKQLFAFGQLQSAIKNQQSSIVNLQSLIITLHSIASRCLFNPSQPREYQLALYMACLGGLKYTNLTPHQKHFLYLTAAQLATNF